MHSWRSEERLLQAADGSSPHARTSVRKKVTVQSAVKVIRVQLA